MKQFRHMLGFGRMGGFDSAYYLETNPDIAQAGGDPLEHYNTHGWREGRNPSSSFVTLYYIDKHLRGEDSNPLLHYQKTGKKLGLNTAPLDRNDYVKVQAKVCRQLFSPAFYSSQLGQATAGDPLAHYLESGWRQGLMPTSTFDPRRYLSEHGFIEKLDVSPFYHYASLSSRLRPAAPLPSIKPQLDDPPAHVEATVSLKAMRDVLYKEFDAAYYLRQNPDVQEASVDPLDHYIRHGWQEGRKPHPLFDPRFYTAQFPELADLGIDPFYYHLRIGRRQNVRTNPVGDRLYPPMRAPSARDWDAVTGAADMAAAQCVVILPAYQGRDETLAAIFAVLSARQRTPFALHVVNDRSPDAELSADLQDLSRRGLISLAVNEVNLGFVRSVNAALARLEDKPVVLLNSDARVSGDWIDRFMRHAARDPSIATITPFSNNATIFSYPLLNENNIIELERDAAGIDELASVCNAGRVSDMPTGVGFCFYMSVESRKAVGILDQETFGKGYGEENDFCLRAAKAGFRNVLAEDCFVYHVGEVSFGRPDSAKSAPGQKALRFKHPEYPERVRRHLRADESEIGRARLDLMRMAATAGQAPVVFVYHALTGGITKHVRDEEERLRAQGTNVIHIRVGVGNRYNIEIRSGAKDAPFCPNLRPFAFAQFHQDLTDFLGWLKPGSVHIHSLVGLDWAATLGLLDMIRGLGMPYQYTLHDYSVVCHRNDLVLQSFRFCGLPDVAVCRKCVAHDRSFPETIDPGERRATFARFLEGAQEVFAPSRDIADRLHAAGARYAITIAPHAEEPPQDPIEPKRHTGEAIVALLGAIGPHKGSHLLLSLARDAQERELPIRYHIVGYSDIPLELKSVGVEETGRYSSVAEARQAIAWLAPSLIFLPSIWPETFSYTLSLAFTFGIRPVVLDIGAPAERIRDKGFGEILPYELIDDIKALNDRLIALAAETPATRVSDDRRPIEASH